MQEILEALLDVNAITDLLNPTAALYLAVALLVLFVGKWINDRLTPYQLDEQLTVVDNKAVAVSLSGYLFGLGIILWGVLVSPSDIEVSGNIRRDLMTDLASTAIWGVVGIILLQIARIINNRLLLPEFDIVKELVEDRNVGAGAVQCGSYVGSALMIRAAISGEAAGSLAISIGITVVYFLVGQIAFILFSKLYQAVSRFDLHAEIEADNVAAGISFGMTLTAVGVLLSGYILKYDSLIGLLVWFVIGAFLLLVARYLVDKLILPGTLLDEEISKDRNWGAALLEGTIAIALAFILNAAF